MERQIVLPEDDARDLAGLLREVRGFAHTLLSGAQITRLDGWAHDLDPSVPKDWYDRERAARA
jgi:hypothetical protein